MSSYAYLPILPSCSGPLVCFVCFRFRTVVLFAHILFFFRRRPHPQRGARRPGATPRGSTCCQRMTSRAPRWCAAPSCWPARGVGVPMLTPSLLLFFLSPFPSFDHNNMYMTIIPRSQQGSPASASAAGRRKPPGRTPRFGWRTSAARTSAYRMPPTRWALGATRRGECCTTTVTLHFTPRILLTM